MSETKMIPVNGHSLHVTIDGPEGAPALTFTHSLAASAEMWREQAETFSKDYRCLRIDTLGHGKSDAPPGPYDFDKMGDEVVKVWDALGVAKSDFIGLSMGGIIGIGIALNHPDRLNKVVCCDCRADVTPAFKENWAKRIAMYNEGGFDAIADTTLATWFVEKTRTTRPEFIERIKTMIKSTPDNGYRGVVGALQKLDYKRRLGEISVPFLYFVGDEDVPMNDEMKVMADMTPGSEYYRMPGTKHLPNLEKPEEFDRVVRDFLKGGSAASNRGAA